jgi:hypothetical protein
MIIVVVGLPKSPLPSDDLLCAGIIHIHAVQVRAIMCYWSLFVLSSCVGGLQDRLIHIHMTLGQ